jgi:hypothetical protein
MQEAVEIRGNLEMKSNKMTLTVSFFNSHGDIAHFLKQFWF